MAEWWRYLPPSGGFTLTHSAGADNGRSAADYPAGPGEGSFASAQGGNGLTPTTLETAEFVEVGVLWLIPSPGPLPTSLFGSPGVVWCWQRQVSIYLFTRLPYIDSTTIHVVHCQHAHLGTYMPTYITLPPPPAPPLLLLLVQIAQPHGCLVFLVQFTTHHTEVQVSPPPRPPTHTLPLPRV